MPRSGGPISGLMEEVKAVVQYLAYSNPCIGYLQPSAEAPIVSQELLQITDLVMHSPWLDNFKDGQEMALIE